MCISMYPVFGCVDHVRVAHRQNVWPWREQIVKRIPTVVEPHTTLICQPCPACLPARPPARLPAHRVVSQYYEPDLVSDFVGMYGCTI